MRTPPPIGTGPQRVLWLAAAITREYHAIEVQRRAGPYPGRAVVMTPGLVSLLGELSIAVRARRLG